MLIGADSKSLDLSSLNEGDLEDLTQKISEQKNRLHNKRIAESDYIFPNDYEMKMANWHGSNGKLLAIESYSSRTGYDAEFSSRVIDLHTNPLTFNRIRNADIAVKLGNLVNETQTLQRLSHEDGPENYDKFSEAVAALKSLQEAYLCKADII